MVCQWSANRGKSVLVIYVRGRVRGVGGFDICLTYISYSHHNTFASGMDGFLLAGNHHIGVVINISLLKHGLGSRQPHRIM